MFWWWVHKQTECVPDEPWITHNFGRKLQNFENPICIGRYFDLKIECSSLRFARRSQFCLCIFLPMLTKSFLPDIIVEILSSSSNETISSLISLLTDFPFFCNVKDKTPFSLAKSLDFWIKYCETWKYSLHLSIDHWQGQRVRYWIFPWEVLQL